MSGENEPPIVDGDPIDADFEPAPARDETLANSDLKKSRAKKSGPGWGALGVTGVLAAIFGAGAGTVLSGAQQSDYAPDTLVQEFETLVSGQAEKDANAQKSLAELGTTLRREISALEARSGAEAAIADVTDQLASMSAQLEAAEIAAQEAGEADGLQLDQMLARLEALETLDADEVASPRVANRTIKVVQRRIEELEAEIATRSETLQALEERVLATETQMQENAASAPEIGQVEDIAALKRSVAAMGTQEAEMQAMVARANAGQARLFAMLSIEAAAREGRDFQPALAQLEKAMPQTPEVANLRPLAAKGAPTTATLEAEFQIAREAAARVNPVSQDTGDKSGETGDVQEDAKKDAKKDGWGWVRSALGDAVVVRRTVPALSQVAGKGFTEAMDTAQAALMRGDVAGAISVVERLDGPRRQAFAGWLSGANDRVKLEQGLAALRLALMDTER